MQYIGIPTCPYCKKRVNLIRTWSLKRQGEYQCPRCGGISNIYLSPLVYVFALIAVLAGAAIYFFHKFILNDIALDTSLQVILPFLAFFLLSLFTVRLEKPVIKKMSRAELERKKGKKSRTQAFTQPGAPKTPLRRPQPPAPLPEEEYGEYFPTDYRTGPVPLPENLPQEEKKKSYASYEREYESEYDEYDRKHSDFVSNAFVSRETSPGRKIPQKQRNQAGRGVRELEKTTSLDDTQMKTIRSSTRRPTGAESPVRIYGEETRPAPQKRRSPEREPFTVQIPESTAPGQASRAVSSVEIPGSTDDFFSKYDDPAYIERRMRELHEKNS